MPYNTSDTADTSAVMMTTPGFTARGRRLTLVHASCLYGLSISRLKEERLPWAYLWFSVCTLTKPQQAQQTALAGLLPTALYLRCRQNLQNWPKQPRAQWMPAGARTWFLCSPTFASNTACMQVTHIDWTFVDCLGCWGCASAIITIKIIIMITIIGLIVTMTTTIEIRIDRSAWWQEGLLSSAGSVTSSS